MEINYSIFTVVLGQIVRHFVSMVSGFLTIYGVSEAQQGELTEAVVAISVGVVAFLVAQGWAYFSKRIAFETPTDGEGS